MKKTDTKTPFKLNILGFRLETTIAEMSFMQIVIIIFMSMMFLLALVFLLGEYATTGISILTIVDKISKLEILKIIKSRSP